MRFAANAAQAGGSDQALFDFGAAMHPLMDMTSPAHTDYATGEPRPWCGVFGSCSNTFDHGGDSDAPNPWSIEDLDALNSRPDVQDAENDIIRRYYHDLTGRGCHCKH